MPRYNPLNEKNLNKSAGRRSYGWQGTGGLRGKSGRWGRLRPATAALPGFPLLVLDVWASPVPGLSRRLRAGLTVVTRASGARRAGGGRAHLSRAAHLGSRAPLPRPVDAVPPSLPRPLPALGERLLETLLYKGSSLEKFRLRSVSKQPANRTAFGW